MEFFTVSNGVWIVPEQSVTTPTNLMMYHGNGDKNIQVRLALPKFSVYFVLFSFNRLTYSAAVKLIKQFVTSFKHVF